MKDLLQANLCLYEYHNLTPAQQELFDRLYMVLQEFFKKGVFVSDLNALQWAYDCLKEGTPVNFHKKRTMPFHNR